MHSKRYPTDLSDDEWHCIGTHLPEHTGQGRPRLHGLRAILDAVFYVLKSGCPWRLLPKDFPPWKTRLRLVQEVAHRWYLGALERRAARALAGAPWQGSRSQRRYCGLPDDQDHGGGRH